MTTGTIANRKTETGLKWNDWLRIGLKTAFFSILSVLLVQALTLTFWPDIGLFKPLNSYPRSALFTLVPALGATAVFAWMTRHLTQPVKKFIILSGVLLLLSFIPDYALPLDHKSVLASSVAAFMHLIAGTITVLTIVRNYRSQVR